MLLHLLIAAASFHIGSSVRCYVCDGEMDCSFPVQKECPPNNECFTVAESYDPRSNGLRKGCTATCDISNIYGKICRTCKGNLCNAREGLGKAFEKPKPLPPRGPFGPRDKNSANNERISHVFGVLSICFVATVLFLPV